VRSEFNERIFEFCCTYELCRSLGGLHLARPFFPSLPDEKKKGFDVELKRRNYHKSLFLQYKVPFYVESLRSNRRFYEAHNGSYYRFVIDNNQHNKLHNLQLNGEDAFYCAPRFYKEEDLMSYMDSKSVVYNSVMIDPTYPIVDSDRHNITYDPDGTKAFLHSESKSIERVFVGEESFSKMQETEQPIDIEYIEHFAKNIEKQVEGQFKMEIENFSKLNEKTRERVKKFEDEPHEHREVEKSANKYHECKEMRKLENDQKAFRESLQKIDSPVGRAQFMLGRYYRVHWILFR